MSASETPRYTNSPPRPRTRREGLHRRILAAVLALLMRPRSIGRRDRPLLRPVLAGGRIRLVAGRVRPGDGHLLISMFGMIYFFLKPGGTFYVEGLSSQLATAVFYFCGVCGAGEAARPRARGRWRWPWSGRRNCKARWTAAPRPRTRPAKPKAASAAWPTVLPRSSGCRTWTAAGPTSTAPGWSSPAALWRTNWATAGSGTSTPTTVNST